MSKILIAEDDRLVLDGLALNLAREGFAVVKVERGDKVVDLVIKENPDLVVLDVMLPGLNGFAVCQELRRHRLFVPVIMLTARAEEVDRVVGLEIGADDYVTKPFSLREFLARVRAHLRRSALQPSRPANKFVVENLEIDFENLAATRNGHPIDLTRREYDILALLIGHRGELVTRQQMLREIWGYKGTTNTRTIDTHILKLRQKIEEDPSHPRFIHSVYGAGYRFQR